MEGWRASGESAARYAERRGYSLSSLCKWATEQRREGKQKAAMSGFVKVEVEAGAAMKELVVEIGEARIRLKRGFDHALLSEVMGALLERAER